MLKKPKIALVCDDLIQFGGHEKVILDICNIYPNAPLYCLGASKEWRNKLQEKSINVHVSWLDKVPFFKFANRVLATFLFHNLAIESFDLSDFDVIFSISSRFAHCVKTRADQMHICYMSTVPRMLWEPDIYFERELTQFPLWFKKLGLFCILPFLSYMRILDYISAQKVDHFISNSLETQKRISKYYKKRSALINPSIKIHEFVPVNPVKKGNYYLTLTRLVSWKHVDIAIEACKNTNNRLLVVGDGPDMTRLKQIAGGDRNIEFLGYVSDQQKKLILKEAKALIVTQKEDYGLSILEAICSDTFVIAYRSGGATEILSKGKAGVFFEEQNSSSLKKVLSRTDLSIFPLILEEKKLYDYENFKQNIQAFVDKVYYMESI